MSPSRKSKAPRAIDPTKYSSRFIALKLAYLGHNYNGLEHHSNNTTSLPTVEEELWKALYKARLIFPQSKPSIAEGEPNWEGCDYSKCGRTDKGVSAFGQVIGLRVRSNRPRPRLPKPFRDGVSEKEVGVELLDKLHYDSLRQDLEYVSDDGQLTPASSISSDNANADFHSICDETPYPKVLNRLLPPDIRILAWCPNTPPNFSARFSCKERRYRYFFTSPAFSPTLGRAAFKSHSVSVDAASHREGWLDIERMREAAAKFVGLHDFRNFCKVDPSKQINNFNRRIFQATIEEVLPHEQSAGYMAMLPFAQRTVPSTPPNHYPNSQDLPSDIPKLYAFSLHGSAFLWHQVRHMIAILFLIGQGLEHPSLIDELLNVEKHPTKPTYEMADDAPLVLWDCIFLAPGSQSREDALEWIYVGGEPGRESNSSRGRTRDDKFDVNGLIPDLWKVWRRRKMDEVLAGTLLNLAVRQGRNDGTIEAQSEHAGGRGSQKVFLGGDTYKLAGKYVPVLEKPRMERVEVVNERYARKKGLDVKMLKMEDGNE